MILEETAISILKTRVNGRPSPEGIGDDAAILRAEDGRVCALDSMIEGVHFDLNWSSWADVAYKLLATNISDIWAMGALPTAFLLSLSLQTPLLAETIEEIARGLCDVTKDYAPNLVLVGGDTTRSKKYAMLSATVIGKQILPPLLRSKARVSQQLWIDGPVGFAAAGLAALTAGHKQPQFILQHRRPQMIRPDFAKWKNAGATAAIDISDGLLLDLHRLASASKVHIEIFSSLFGLKTLKPFAEQINADPKIWQHTGGDDYVRVVACNQQPEKHFTQIGNVISGAVGLTIISQGDRQLLHQPIGFRHFQ